MDYTPLTYPCPRCGSNRVGQDPVCALVGKPLMLHFFCCECNHQWDRQYEPPKDKSTTKEFTTMQVSYKGFTGELKKLEQTFAPNPYVPEYATYDLVIAILKEGVYARVSFTGVYLKDVKFLGGTVAFVDD